MKACRRTPPGGSQTPWEKFSGDVLAAGTSAFVLVLDAEGRLIAATPTWHARFERWWTWREPARWRDVRVEHGSQTAWRQWSVVLRRALGAGAAFETKVTLRRARREVVRLACVSHPVLDPTGKTAGVIFAGRFDDAGTAEVATAASERAPGSLAGSSCELAALWVHARRRRGERGYFVERASAGARRLLPLSDQLIAGAGFPECLPPALRRHGAALLDAAIATEEPASIRVSADRESATASAFDLELSVLPAGALRYCFTVRRDAWGESGRRLLIAGGGQIVALEGQLRRAQRLATQGTVAAAIGHEVNNCLGVALANAALFREHYSGSPEATRAIDPVINSVQTAGKICQRFRNLSERGEAAPETIDLAVVVQRGFGMLVRIIARQITFENEAAAPLWVRVDPVHIEQIVVNLVLNARDATRHGTGVIAVRVGRDTTTKAGRHWLEVADDGEGIPPEIQRKLFTAFFTTKPNKRGTGLGLATVLRLTKAMGGDVKLTSQPGRGTTLRITLPAIEKPADSAL